jgi:uracil-DNA glycosylase
METFKGLRSLIENIKTDWKDILIHILDKNVKSESAVNYLLNLEYSKKKIFPPQKDIFNAFQFFNISELKVIILGQDVYHSEGQAHGLSFSVRDGCKIPPSLKNIFKELTREFGEERKESDLSDWAKQGVLLLNTALTVVEHQPESHLNIWKPFTEEIIKYIGEKKEGVVCMLWGNHAKGFSKLLNPGKNYILEWTHPSPLSRKKFDCDHFQRCNEFLEKQGKEKIKWV